MQKGWQESNYGGIVPTSAVRVDNSVSSYPYPGGVNQSWDHGVGRTCFTRTIDTEMYPPISKIKNK